MNLLLILVTNYSDCLWTLDGEDYSGLEWLDESPKPTKAALEKQSADVEYQAALKAVSEQRRQAYTLESDPLNFKYQETELAEDKAAWLAKKAEIQARYPEPVQPASK